MPDADPFPRVKRAIIRVLLGALSPHGFVQHNKTVYFYRDRDDLRDIFFIQKMRSDAITLTYGVKRRPDDWEPGIPNANARRLNEGDFYCCKYVDHVERSIARLVTDFESEAIPYFSQFQSPDDLPA